MDDANQKEKSNNLLCNPNHAAAVRDLVNQTNQQTLITVCVLPLTMEK
jgi:hypothetical protein